jgi:hypothetical protein
MLHLLLFNLSRRIKDTDGREGWGNGEMFCLQRKGDIHQIYGYEDSKAVPTGPSGDGRLSEDTAFEVEKANR